MREKLIPRTGSVYIVMNGHSVPFVDADGGIGGYLGPGDMILVIGSREIERMGPQVTVLGPGGGGIVSIAHTWFTSYALSPVEET